MTDCQEPGTIVRDRVEETSRGYGYDFYAYLPPCYETDTKREYPILYLIPGLGGGTRDWFEAGVDDVAEEMIVNGRIAPFIIIHTETNHGGDPNSDIIFNDLLPYVESHYRILKSRQYRAAAGGSRGGIGAYRLVLQHPDQFASAGIFGSGLVNGEETQLQNWLKAMPEPAPRLFFNTGEQDPLMLERAEVMIELLEGSDIETSTLFSPGDHSYRYWTTNMEAYFAWMAEDW